MFHLHCTKKLLDRIKPEIVAPGQSDTALGNWYATVLFWKPQVALLVSERTLLPVLMPLAPAATLARRFPGQLALVLKEHGVPPEFIAQEVWRMDTVQYAKTANRSVVGILKARKSDIPMRNVDVPLQITVADGGRDATVHWQGGRASTDYFPGRDTVFSCKASDGGDAAWAKEVCTKASQGKKKKRELKKLA